MKKILIFVAIIAVTLSFALVTDASAKGPTKRAGKSNIGHLYLFQKDDSTWEIVEDGAWGKMTYKLSGRVFKFIFNGHHLMSEDDYTLIYYPDPWPGNGLICLGSGLALLDEEDGSIDVHIMGRVDTGDLPAEYDANTDGAKIWLVLSNDVDCEGNAETQTLPHMTGWNPDHYLFEYDLITFDDTNGS
jgi:hypothetical protein